MKMKNYRGVKVIIGGLIEHKVEIWDEHNHCQVYSEDRPIFDGYYLIGTRKFSEEVSRICQNAEKFGMSCEVVKI